MPQLNHATDSPLRALVLIPRHRNSRMCRSDAEGMETVWRSSSPRCPPSRHTARQNLASARRCQHTLALEGAHGRIAVTLLVKRLGAGQGLAKVRHREARGCTLTRSTAQFKFVSAPASAALTAAVRDEAPGGRYSGSGGSGGGGTSGLLGNLRRPSTPTDIGGDPYGSDIISCTFIA
jgi:hypothetical protein